MPPTFTDALSRALRAPLRSRRRDFARATAHIPDKHQVMTRYYGWYANRTRGERRQLAAEDGAPEIAIAQRERLTLSESRLRWAELLRRIFEVDSLRCPRCAAEMRIVAFITERAVIDRILAHLAHLAHLAKAREGEPGARGPPASRAIRGNIRSTQRT